MKKKLLSLALVSAMVLGSTITASAEGNINTPALAGSGQEITGSSTVKTPTIDITVPTTAEVVINPYKMKATIDEKDYTDQIATVPQEIENSSDVKVAVNVENLKAVPTSGVAISSSSLASKTSGAKSVFLYLEVVAGGKDAAQFKGSYDSKTMLACPAAAAGLEEEKIKAVSKAAIITLDEKNGATTKASFKMGGDVIANPTKVNDDKTTSADPWTADDNISFSFKFTFTPQINAAQ